MSIPDVDTGIELEEMDVGKMKEEMFKLKQQMAEMYQAWSIGQSPPSYPTNPGPSMAQTQDNLTTELSPNFPIYQHYRGTTSQTPQSPPPKPVPYFPPPVTPVFVAPPPATFHKSLSEPIFQAQDNQYYPRSPPSRPPKSIQLLLVLTSQPKLPIQSKMLNKKRCSERSKA